MPKTGAATRKLPAWLVGYKAGSDLVSKVAFFAVTVMAARALPAGDFGAFSIAWTLGWLLGLAADMGLQVHLAREVARDPDRAGAICRTLLPARLGAALLAVAVVVALVAGRLPNGRVGAFAIIVLAQICGSLIEFFNSFFRGLSRSDVESSVNLAHRLGTLALAWLLLTNGGGLDSLAIALFVPAAVALVFDAQLALSGRASRGSRADARLSWLVFRRDVLPIGVGTILSALYFRVDLFLVQYWTGDAGAGLYNAVFRLIEALRLFPAAVLAVMFPQFCVTRDGRLLWSTSLTLGAAGTILAAGVYATAPAIVEVFYGRRYLDAVDAFRVLTLSLPLLFLNYVLTHQLIGWNRQRAYAWTCGGCLALNLVANALWIPRFGLVGAAWATFVTELALAGGCAFMLTQRRVAAEAAPALQG